VRDYAGCAARGLTLGEASRELGVSKAAASYAARNHGLRFAPQSMFRHDYAGCAAAGMTAAESARALGVSSAAVSYAAKRLGLTFRRYIRPKNTPTYRTRLSLLLTPAEFADYELLTKSHRYRRDEALRAIGRADLIETRAEKD
jgi:hypothetical protein